MTWFEPKLADGLVSHVLDRRHRSPAMVSVSSVLPLEGVADQAVIDAWLAAMAGPRGEDDIAYLREACAVAKALFGDSLEPTGQQRCLHRLHVAEILNGLALDSKTLAAGILHGVGTAPGYDEKQLRGRVDDTVVRMLRDLDRIGAVAAIYQSKTLDHVEDRQGRRVVVYHVVFENDPDVTLEVNFRSEDPDHRIIGIGWKVE